MFFNIEVLNKLYNQQLQHQLSQNFHSLVLPFYKKLDYDRYMHLNNAKSSNYKVKYFHKTLIRFRLYECSRFPDKNDRITKKCLEIVFALYIRQQKQELIVKSQCLNKSSHQSSIITINPQKHLMFYNFSFETQAHLDEDCPMIHSDKPYTMQNTTDTSPASIKSHDSFGLQIEHHNDCNFELGSQASHASKIWDASVNLLKNSLQYPSESQNGFNDEDIYRYTTFSYGDKDKTLDEAIKSNRLLRYREKTNFIQTLQKETQLCGLLVELMTLFNFQIFSQLLFIVHSVWNQRYLKYRQEKSNKKTSFSIPRFNCFFGIEGEQYQTSGIDTQYKDAKQISSIAKENIQELAKQIFSSKKIRYLNFQNIKGAKMNNRVLKEEFEKFIEAVSKGVFLSAQGIYEEQVSIPVFSEEEEEEFSLFNLDNGNRFVRAYSQIQQEDENEFKVQGGSKHRKLF